MLERLHDSQQSDTGPLQRSGPGLGQPRRHRVGITGTGSYTPARVLSNDDFARMVDTSDEWIRERTGMRERRIAADDEATSDLAIEAAHRALASARLDPTDVELILVATATPDTFFPSTACRVQKALGCVRAAGFDIAAACAGFVNALMTAESILAAGLYRNALVIGAEKLSTITDYEDRNTCVLFGDGAGAVVLGNDIDRTGSMHGPRNQPLPGQILDHVIRIDGDGLEMIQQPAGGSLRPASAETVAAKQHVIRLEGRRVFRFAVQVICDAVTEILARNGFTIDDLDLLVPHQANLRIIEAANAKLGIDPARVAVNIEKYGNTSSASVPIAFDEMVRSGRVKPGQLVCMVAFGSGLSWGASLVRW